MSFSTARDPGAIGWLAPTRTRPMSCVNARADQFLGAIGAGGLVSIEGRSLSISRNHVSRNMNTHGMRIYMGRMLVQPFQSYDLQLLGAM